MEKNEKYNDWISEVTEFVSNLLINKMREIGNCEKCPLSRYKRNVPEIGALAGKSNWLSGLLGDEIKPSAVVILGPSGRHYMTGIPDTYSKKWEELVGRFFSLLEKGDQVKAAYALMQSFEVRISSALSWPKGGWLYGFLDNFGKKYGESFYFTRMIKCGVKELTDTFFEKVLKICSNYIIPEIKLLHPKIVITIGNDNFNFFKNLIKNKKAYLIEAFSSLDQKRVGKNRAMDSGLVKIHSNGYRFLIRMKGNIAYWLIPLLHPEFFLNYFDAFTNIIRKLEQLPYPSFPMGEYFEDIKNIFKHGPAAVYLYPLWLNLRQVFSSG
ncbi:MAG: uracil-DNA glycosylase family protein [Candidatus Njordarchaeia archaeon]